MATKPLTFRLEPELAAIVDEQAKNAGRDRAAHLAAIVESHLRGNGQLVPSDEFLQCHEEILRQLRSLSTETETHRQAISKETETLSKILAHKEQEASRDNAARVKQIDQLRADIATLFAAALQSFAGVEESAAVTFTQKYMYRSNGRA